VPKAIKPESGFGRELTAFDDAIWAAITRHIPKKPLPVDVNASLREAITKCCSEFMTERALLAAGQKIAAAMPKGQFASFERVIGALRTIAATCDPKTNRPSDLLLYNELEDLAGRLERISSFEPPIEPDPWPAFVRSVAECFRDVAKRLRDDDLTPTVTMRFYKADEDGGGKPTWFQEFVADLHENLLGQEGYAAAAKALTVAGERRQEADVSAQYNRRALHAAVVKAMRGDRKPGKSQK
jgi:hypothetical protein